MTKPLPMLLYNEPPIAVSPTLCRLLGLPEAVFLQQLHYRLHQKASDLRTYEKYMVDGRHWVYWTHQELLREIPLGRSTDPHKRIIKRLRNAGILLVRQLQATDWNHTNYFSIDYDAFELLIQTGKLAPSPIGGNATNRTGGKPPIDEQESHPSAGGDATDQFTKTTTESSTDTTTTGDAPLELHPATEPYRELIEKSVVGLSGELAQSIADEAAGTLLAIRDEGHKPIHSMHRWIQSLAEAAQAGKFFRDKGKAVAAARREARRKAQQAAAEAAAKEVSSTRRNARIAEAGLCLKALGEPDLAKLADAVENDPALCKAKSRVSIREAVLRRTMPTSRIEESILLDIMARLGMLRSEPVRADGSQ
ncbi:MAG: hypothetical protein ACOY3V_01860 [Pseudomonadota bacterium]